MSRRCPQVSIDETRYGPPGCERGYRLASPRTRYVGVCYQVKVTVHGGPRTDQKRTLPPRTCNATEIERGTFQVMAGPPTTSIVGGCTYHRKISVEVAASQSHLIRTGRRIETYAALRLIPGNRQVGQQPVQAVDVVTQCPPARPVRASVRRGSRITARRCMTGSGRRMYPSCSPSQYAIVSAAGIGVGSHPAREPWEPEEASDSIHLIEAIDGHGIVRGCPGEGGIPRRSGIVAEGAAIQGHVLSPPPEIDMQRIGLAGAIPKRWSNEYWQIRRSSGG